jgi:acyl dehydratase
MISLAQAMVPSPRRTGYRSEAVGPGARRQLTGDGHVMSEIFLDDLEAGQRYELGARVVRQDEIVAFARDYDPQPFHVDEGAARSSIYGGLIASGWHTVCMFMRLFVDGFLHRAASMGSPGVDELRWLKPVRPGDQLAGRIEIVEIRPSRSRADRGIARMRSIMSNQDGEEVLSMVASVMLRRRGEPRP